MAKQATQRGKGGQAAKAAASAAPLAVPAKTVDAAPSPEQGMTTLPSSGDFASPLADVAPAEVLGSFPPQEPSSAQPVTQPEHTTGLIDPPAEDTPQADSNQPTAETTNPPDDSTIVDEGAGGSEGKAPALPNSADVEVSPPEAHPAIALAQRHHTGTGKPREGAPRYLTPQPFDVFAKRKQ